MPSGRTNNYPESGPGLGHVTPIIFGRTVGYPSDSLASCLLIQHWTTCSVLLVQCVSMHFLFTFHAYSVYDELKNVGWSVYTGYDPGSRRQLVLVRWCHRWIDGPHTTLYWCINTTCFVLYSWLHCIFLRKTHIYFQWWWGSLLADYSMLANVFVRLYTQPWPCSGSTLWPVSVAWKPLPWCKDWKLTTIHVILNST